MVTRPDAASRILKALGDGERTEPELEAETLLTRSAILNGLRNLVRENRVKYQRDQGAKLWSLR